MDKRDLERMTQIEAYAVKVLSEDQTGHSMDHINRVVKNARNIQEIEGGDLFLILSGAYLHDVMDDKLVENPQKAREELKKLLISLELEEKVVEHLFEIIDNVSFSHQLEQKEPPKLSLEAKIVQDADRLDAIGAIGIGRTFYYGGKKGHTLYDSTIPPRDNMTKEDYRINQTVINHFYEKLFKLPDLMQTTTGKKLAYDRKDLMVNFVNAFIEELE
ncbi:HD domain-containing protein [Vagococcus fluvialis]|uniref:HD domain-containing protein n=1 Tax=Vagococcus fluvialis TaxID=2738 RepID=UPI003B5B83A6